MSTQHSKVSFTNDDDSGKAALLRQEDTTAAVGDSCGVRYDDLYTDVSKPINEGNECNNAEGNSGTTRRPRTRSTIAKELDQIMIEREESVGFFSRYQRLFALLPVMILGGASQMFIQPILPGIYMAYFGDPKRAGEITSYVNAAVAFIGLFTCAFYGKLLDTVGRRPFFILAPIFQNAIPTLLLVLFRKNPMIYLLTSGAGNIIQTSFLSAYVADSYSTKSRVAVFAIVEGIGNTVAVFGQFVKVLDETTLITLSCVCSFGLVLYVIIFIKETLPDELRQPFAKEVICSENPFDGLAVVVKSKVCCGASIVLGSFLFAQIGSSDIMVYYLHQRIGFDANDIANWELIYGVLTPSMLLIVLPLISKKLSQITITCISLVALLVELVLLSVIWAKWAMFWLVTPLVALSVMMTPLMSMVVANAGNPADQGRRLTGLTAFSDLADAIGPLVFGSIYGNVSEKLAFLPFIVAMILLVPAFIATFLLPRLLEADAAKREVQVAEAVARGRSASTINSLVREKRDPIVPSSQSCDSVV